MRPRKDSRLVVRCLEIGPRVAFSAFLLVELLAVACSGNRQPIVAPPTFGVPVEWLADRGGARVAGGAGQRGDGGDLRQSEDDSVLTSTGADDQDAHGSRA